MNELLFNQESEKLRQFAELRKTVHKEINAKTAERIKNNPQPTEEEILAGAFREMIEPQVREAVFEFYCKGYAAESSGFGGEFGEIQSIDGYFEIDPETKRKIEALGAKVLKGGIDLPNDAEYYTFIQFEPVKPELNEIKFIWDKIATILPPKNEPAPPSISGGSDEFRKQYAKDRLDIEKVMLTRRLALSRYEPEAEKLMKQRIDELSDRI